MDASKQRRKAAGEELIETCQAGWTLEHLSAGSAGDEGISDPWASVAGCRGCTSMADPNSGFQRLTSGTACCLRLLNHCGL